MRAWLRPAATSVAVVILSLSSGALAADPACDDFAAGLSPGWDPMGSGQVIAGDICYGNMGLFRWWSADVFDADQFSEAVIAAGKPADALVQVSVRRRSADGARYGFHYAADTGFAEWQIKFDGVKSSCTVVLATSTLVPAPQPGDTIRLEACGSGPVVLTGKLNGQVVLVAQDDHPAKPPGSCMGPSGLGDDLGAIVATGPPGIVSRRVDGAPPVPGTPIFASWCGGSLAACDGGGGAGGEGGTGGGGAAGGGGASTGGNGAGGDDLAGVGGAGASGVGGTTGVGAEGGGENGGAPGSGGSTPSGGSGADPGDEGGCSCVVAGGRGARGWAIIALGAAAVAVAWRRRAPVRTPRWRRP